MSSRSSRLAVALAATLTACGSATSTATNTPTATRATPTPSAAAAPASTTAPCAVSAQPQPATTVAAAFPTALAFAPDGRLFYTERAGTVKVWQGGSAHTFASVAVASDGERGLLGLAISPTFAADRFVYAFYSDTNRTEQHVIRWHDCAGTGTDAKVIVTLPAGGDCCHKGGRVVFGSDNMLYVTLGEEHVAAAAQNTGDVRGKVLRYRGDGSVPPDNPFGAGNPVWAYGLRNPFGIAVGPGGQIAVTNNGPSGDAGSRGSGYDTLILSLGRGGGYQWPYCYGYSHPLQAADCRGRTAPDWSSESATFVPTGAAFIDAAGPPSMAGHLVFCTFDSGMLIATAGSPHAAVAGGPSQCRLAVVEGPDHAVYVSDAGHIYRLT